MRRGIGLLVTFLLVSATLLAGWVPASADEEQSALDVQITEITPTVLRPGDDWVIQGTVTNTGTEELSDPVIRLRFQTYVPSSRSALAEWNVDGESLVTTVLVAQPLGSDLDPGQQRRGGWDDDRRDDDSDNGKLPRTGATLAGLGAGVTLLGAGIAALVASRRRKA